MKATRAGSDGRGPRNTSRRCPACGHTAKENRPTQEQSRCVSCGHTHADTVGAINVLQPSRGPDTHASRKRTRGSSDPGRLGGLACAGGGSV
ncbi:zinc ribbon domain-containing protein [Streptomyces antimycoticus]|uniref:zinc ribbon domain-containing protein n=1 Tax=Streptomyces antimycoticus TaxID=68175 RepID=UPI00341C6454